MESFKISSVDVDKDKEGMQVDNLSLVEYDGGGGNDVTKYSVFQFPTEDGNYIPLCKNLIGQGNTIYINRKFWIAKHQSSICEANQDS